MSENSSDQRIQAPPIGGRWPTLVLLLLILVSFTTRTYRLEAKSMWVEEGLSIYRAQQDLPHILSNIIMIQDVATHDTHPPLYFFVLHFLIGVAGTSEFAFRFLSVAWGVLLVPLMYAFGARLLGRRAGLWAAGIAALSPVYLWYSQETRSYTMLVFLTAFSNYCLLRLWHSAQPADRRAREMGLWTTGYLVLAMAAVFTHYQALFILVFQWAVVLSLALWQRRWWLLGLSAGASVFAVPLVPFVVSRLQTGPERGYRFVSLFIMARDLWNAFSMGIGVEMDDVVSLDLLFLVVFVLGLVLTGLGSRTRGPGRLLYLLGHLLIPTLSLHALSHVKPMYQGVRHLLIVSPPYYLAIAAGLDGLSRRFRYLTIAVAVVMVAGVAYSTCNSFFEPRYAKDDLRSAAAYLRKHLERGELLVVSEPILWPVWEYYYGPDLPWTALPTYPQVAGEQTVEELEALAGEWRGIWFAYGPSGAPRDRKGLVKAWLDQSLFQVDDQDFHSVTNVIAMAHYLTRAPLLSQAPAMEQRLDIAYGEKLALLGHSGLPETLEPGQEVKLSLYWQPLEWLEEDYSLSLVLVDSGGGRWAQTDVIPFNGFYPTSHWVPHGIVVQTVSIPTPYGSPSGQYSWELRLYSPSTWEELQVFDAQGQDHGTAAYLGTVQLEPTPASHLAEMPIQHRRQEQFGGLTKLEGFDLASAQWRAGHALHVDLYWRNLVSLSEEYRVVLRLLDPMGRSLQERAYALPPGPRDTVTRARYDLLIPPRASGMRCSLIVEVQDAEDGNRLPVGPPFWPFKRVTLTLAQVQVAAEARILERPPIQHQFEARLGDQIAFLGYDLEGDTGRAGDTLELVLYWQALEEMESSYTVFVHLLDADGQIRAQADGLPCEGARLTTGWLLGEVVVDRRQMTLPDEISLGTYSLIWGMYDAATGLRLPVSETDGAAPNDSVPGPQIAVVP